MGLTRCCQYTSHSNPRSCPCLHSSIHTEHLFSGPLMGFEPSQEGSPFMKVSIRCWIRIRSQKRKERFRKHFRRMGTGLGGRVGRWYSTDVGASVLPVSSGILAPSCHLQGQRPGCRGGQQWCSHSRNHQDGRSEPPLMRHSSQGPVPAGGARETAQSNSQLW